MISRPSHQSCPHEMKSRYWFFSGSGGGSSFFF